MSTVPASGPCPWERVLGLAVERGLVSPEAAQRVRAAIRPDAAPADVAFLAGIPEEAFRALVFDVEVGEAPETLRLDSTGRADLAGDLLAPTVPSSAPSATLKRIGRYDLLSVIASGGMGTVYRALDPGLHRVVALKTLKSSGQESDPELLGRFLREAQAVARLRHPGIVSLHEQGTSDGTHYFTMDLIEGKSFADALRDGSLRGAVQASPTADAPTVPHVDATPRLSLAQAVAVLTQVAEALGHAHAQGVVHRDVKPQNVLLDAEGRAYVTDFGLAKDARASLELTRTGEVMGTAYYMSPEQSAGEAKQVGPASDVFALGVMLYEAITGQRPFTGDSARAILARIERDDPQPPRIVEPSVPRDLETICLKALEKDPARRYPSGTEIAEDLARYAAGEPIQARPPTRWRRAVRWVRKRPRATATALGVLAAAGLLAAWLAYAEWKDRAAWVLVYDQGRGLDLGADWMPAVGVQGEDGSVWHEDAGELVAEPTTQQGLLVLVRRLPADVRMEYDVWQDGDPPGDIGCFLSSDPRGWEFNDPVARDGSGYFVGVGADNGKRVKVLGEATDRNYAQKYVQEGAKPFAIAREWRHVTVERRGARVRVWVGPEGKLGEMVLDWIDAHPISDDAQHGYCGFYKWQHRYRYRGVRVWARGADPEACRLAGVLDRSCLEYDHGRYAEHQARLRSLLPGLEARPSLRSEVLDLLEGSPEMLAYSSASPAAIVGELEVSYRAWSRDSEKDGGADQGLIRAVGDDPGPLLAMLERMRTLPGITTEKAHSFVLRRVQADIEAGRWAEGLQELAREGTVGHAKPSPAWKGMCLLGQGNVEEAIDALADDPAARAIVEADRGGLAHAKDLLSGAPTWSRDWNPTLALVYQERAGPLPRAAPAAVDDPYVLAVVGMGASRGGDPAKITAEWDRLVPVEEGEAVDPDHPRIREDRDRVAHWVHRSFRAYLAGRGKAADADRYRRGLDRWYRVWVDLAMGIRAEADGDVAQARRMYEACVADGMGLLLPREWAEAGLARLKGR